MRLWRVMLAGLAALLAACTSGNVYQPAPTASLEGGAVQALQIFANGDWRDTGVDMAKGQTYRILAEGMWSMGGLCGYNDAAGVGINPFCALLDPWQVGVSAGALIGRIGPEGRMFGVGTTLTLTAPESGRLFLRAYDQMPLDNSGFMNVTIARGAGPVFAPAPAAAQAIAVAVAPPSAPPPAITGRRVALVVGMSGYQYVSPLPNPPNDARLMARTLKTLGFNLVGGGAQLDLDKAAFDRAVQTFGRQIEGADVALFYYAGHGLQVRGTNWLVPVSANPTREADLDFQMVDTELVLKQMEGAGTRLNIMLLDACRNNPFQGRGLRAARGGLAEMRAPEGTLISYATQPGNVAEDGSGGDSPYTLALAHALPQPGLDVFHLFNQVGLEVKRATGGSQQPWLSSSPITGEFSFVPARPQ